MEDSHEFDTLAATVKISDITSEPGRAWMLDSLKANDTSRLQQMYLGNSDLDRLRDAGVHDIAAFEDYRVPWMDCYNYIPSNRVELEWLGYYIGRNEWLEELTISNHTVGKGDLTREQIEFFVKGLNLNKSIEKLSLGGNIQLNGTKMKLDQFFTNNANLKTLGLRGGVLAHEIPGLISLAKTLECVSLISIEGSVNSFTELFQAVGSHPCMKHLDLTNMADFRCMEALASSLQPPTNMVCRIAFNEYIQIINDENIQVLTTSLLNSRTLLELEIGHCDEITFRGWQALSNLLERRSCNIRELTLNEVGLDDEGVQILGQALLRNEKLRLLDLSWNISISIRGFRALSTLLENPNSSLEELHLNDTNVDENVAMLFARSLAKNKRLKRLILCDFFDESPLNSSTRFMVFSQLLCDSSSINKTFLSNHTLHDLSDHRQVNDSHRLLRLNRNPDKKHVAIIKILISHPDFDVKPLFEWGFATLPLVVSWFHKADHYENERKVEIEKRKLSVIYKFTRGIPTLLIKSHLAQI